MDFSSAKFSLDGAEPDLLPEILHLPNHVVRQSCCVTISELAELYYVGPYETPVVSETQTFDWDRDSLSFVVRDKTEEELNELKEPEDRKVRAWLKEELSKPLHPTISIDDLAPVFKSKLVDYYFSLHSLFYSSSYLTYSDIPSRPDCKYLTKVEAQAAYDQVSDFEEEALKLQFETSGYCCLDPELQPFFKVKYGWIAPSVAPSSDIRNDTDNWNFPVVDF